MYVWQLPERKLSGRGVGVCVTGIRVPDVQRGSAQLPADERVIKRLFSNDLGATDVDQDCRFLHEAQLTLPNKASGRGGQGTRYDDEVRAGQHLIEPGRDGA